MTRQEQAAERTNLPSTPSPHGDATLKTMKRLLIVEDDEFTAMAYQQRFTKEGFQVDVASDGESGIEMIYSKKPDVVLLDLMLPRLNGVEFLKTIRSQPGFRHLPIVVLSNAFLSNMIQEAWQAGASQIIPKTGHSLKQIVAMVRVALDAEEPSHPSADVPDPSPSNRPDKIEKAPPSEAPKPVSPVEKTATDEPANMPAAPATTANAVKNPDPSPSPPLTLPPATDSSRTAGDPPSPPVAASSPSPAVSAKQSPSSPSPEPPRETGGESAPKVEVKPAPETPPPPSARPVETYPPTEDIWTEPRLDLPQEPAQPPGESSQETSAPSSSDELPIEIWNSFHHTRPEILLSLRRLLHEFTSNTRDTRHLLELWQRVHAIAGDAGLFGFQNLSRLATVVEALLHKVHFNVDLVGRSVLRTIAQSIDLLVVLLERSSFPASEPELKANVLILDDERLVCETIENALEKAGLKAMSAKLPSAALDLAQQNSFDLVFSDIEMQEMNGFEFCTKLRQVPNYERCPVILMTRLVDFDLRAQACLSRNCDLIAKPFLEAELAAKALMLIIRSKLDLSAPPETTPAAS
jgi:DNA-binding response OmpR family regulator